MMVENIKDNFYRTKNMVLEVFTGKMVVNMLEDGKMVNSMVKDSTIWEMGIKRLENGVKEEE